LSKYGSQLFNLQQSEKKEGGEIQTSEGGRDEIFCPLGHDEAVFLFFLLRGPSSEPERDSESSTNESSSESENSAVTQRVTHVTQVSTVSSGKRVLTSLENF
jgi:hypothetical protein